MSRVSIYGGASSLKQIYGIKKQALPEIEVISDCSAANICLTEELLLKFYALVGKVGELVETIDYSRASGAATSTYITKMPATARMNHYTYVRFVWIAEHPGRRFDMKDMTQRWDLYYNYRKLGSDKWKDDPATNTLPGLVP